MLNEGYDFNPNEKQKSMMFPSIPNIRLEKQFLFCDVIIITTIKMIYI